jgi:hypothetical protein
LCKLKPERCGAPSDFASANGWRSRQKPYNDLHASPKIRHGKLGRSDTACAHRSREHRLKRPHTFAPTYE